MTNQPEPKAVYVRLPADMAERIQAMSDDQLRSLPNEIIYLLRLALAELDKQPVS
jgi:hypothetical protein